MELSPASRLHPRYPSPEAGCRGNAARRWQRPKSWPCPGRFCLALDGGTAGEFPLGCGRSWRVRKVKLPLAAAGHAGTAPHAAEHRPGSQTSPVPQFIPAHPGLLPTWTRQPLPPCAMGVRGTKAHDLVSHDPNNTGAGGTKLLWFVLHEPSHRGCRPVEPILHGCWRTLALCFAGMSPIQGVCTWNHTGKCLESHREMMQLQAWQIEKMQDYAKFLLSANCLICAEPSFPSVKWGMIIPLLPRREQGIYPPMLAELLGGRCAGTHVVAGAGKPNLPASKEQVAF